MARHWTFGQKVGAGFAFTVGLTVIISIVAVYALRKVVASKDVVIATFGENILDAERLRSATASKVAAVRGYLLDKSERQIAEVRHHQEAFRGGVALLRSRAVSDMERTLLDRMARSESDYQAAAERVMSMRRTDVRFEAVVQAFDDDLVPRKQALAETVDAFAAYEQKMRDEAKHAATAAASSAIALVVAIAIGAVIFSILTAFALTRALGLQIGTAVGQVQSSSAELQAAANQQATGSKEQATAMNEISTTISELLATSRQIAESAQRVASVAGQTVGAARTGEGTVQKANESILGIRRQVDLVVNHMLELGKKSQQIGAVLDIVSELAEQTNILAINATIEAAGAGDAGKRFGVVADEIRKLADRVAGSTKEIRGLIEDVRGAVNTTVMVTETGSKSVDAGNRQFGDVTTSFRQIADLVSTTTEAAREIELSTKQQTTAVEQVNVAIANVSQATKETEASSSQTLQTASQLATLSKDLLRLVRPQAQA